MNGSVFLLPIEYLRWMALRIIHFDRSRATPIERFSSAGASSVHLADGSGEAHAYAVHFEPGGVIGPHPAGFDQLFLVVHGSGWIAGTDGVRHEIQEHQGAFVPRGEIHSKGSDSGMLALMVQSSEYLLSEACNTASHPDNKAAVG